MNIDIRFEESPTEQTKINAPVMADKLRLRLAPLADVIEGQDVRLTLYFLEDGTCRLLIDAGPELEKQISDLAGAPESWN